MEESIKLPEYLFPFKTNNLIRIGESSDGSYLVDENSVKDTDILLSIGVGTIFEFEKKFLEINRVPILAFDGEAGLKPQFKKIKWRIRQIIYLRDLDYIKESVQHFLAPLRFYLFFKNFRNYNLNKNYRRFIKKFVGSEESYISIKEILNNYIFPENFKNIFFQIDIEGGEYKILDEIIEVQDYITGLSIEFHDITKHLSEIEKFISEFNLTLIHTHINNIGGISNDKYPNVIELSFAYVNSNVRVEKLPHELDKPNSNEFFEYSIKRFT